MKYKFLLLVPIIVFALSSCSSRFKTTQTPDDLYYSPEAETLVEYTVATPAPSTNNYYYDNYYLHHKVRNHIRWQVIDDYGYWHDTRYNHCPSNWNSYNSYNGWGNYNDGFYSSYNGYNNYYYGWNNYYNGWGGYNNWYGSYFNPYGGYGYYGWNNPHQIFVANHYPTSIKTLPSSSTISYQNQHYNNSNYTYNQQTGTYQGTNIANDKKVSHIRSNSSGNTWSTPVRTFDNSSSPSKNAGGNSGGFNSKGSSTSKPRG